MRRHALATFLLAGLCVATSASSQVVQQSGQDADKLGLLTVSLGYVQPVGDFGGTTTATSGCAESGVSFGIEAVRRFSGRFDFGAELFVDRNGVDDVSFARQLTPPSDPSNDQKGSSVKGAWTSCWFMVKGGIAGQAGDNVEPFCHLGLGTVFVFGPKMTQASGYYSDESPEPLDPGSGIGFGYGLEAGVLLNQHFTVGLSYLSAPIMISYQYNDASSSRSISNLRLTVGYTFTNSQGTRVSGSERRAK